MIVKRFTLLILSGLLIGPAEIFAARDPFMPPPARNCEPFVKTRPTWQLRGIIGHKEDYRALMISDTGKSRLGGREEQLDANWQLLRVDALSITLAAQYGCTASLRMALKGSIYENSAIAKDVAVAAVAPAAGLRPSTTALTGVR